MTLSDMFPKHVRDCALISSPVRDYRISTGKCRTAAGWGNPRFSVFARKHQPIRDMKRLSEAMSSVWDARRLLSEQRINRVNRDDCLLFLLTTDISYPVDVRNSMSRQGVFVLQAVTNYILWTN